MRKKGALRGGFAGFTLAEAVVSMALAAILAAACGSFAVGGAALAAKIELRSAASTLADTILAEKAYALRATAAVSVSEATVLFSGGAYGEDARLFAGGDGLAYIAAANGGAVELLPQASYAGFTIALSGLSAEPAAFGGHVVKGTLTVGREGGVIRTLDFNIYTETG